MFRRLLPIALVWAIASGIFPQHGSAINIIPVYNSIASVEPSADPTGGLLASLFDYAESYYQGIFEDSRTLTLNYWWEDLDPFSTGTLGLHSSVLESGGYNIESNIRLDNDRTWFIDPTPSDDSEFAMTQTFWRDFSATERSDYFNNFGGSIPATFEVGYRGNAVAGGPAAGVFDLLSTVLHEVGHALGLTNVTNTDLETNDGDYDFSAAWVFGQPLAAEHQAGDRYHLDDPESLMCGGCGSAGLRRRPSHTDLFSMASANDWTTLDVPRREFYGGSNWNNPANWSGNQVPAFNDDAFVRNPGTAVTATLSAAGAAANLTVAEGSNVATGAFKLDIGGTVTARDLNTDVNVAVGGELEAAVIRIEDGADLNVQGGLVDVGTLRIETGADVARVTGTGGNVFVTNDLINNGTIQALSGGTLTFSSPGGSIWNLDGTGGNGIVRATTGNLTFGTGELTDAFDGSMEIGDFVNSRTLSIATEWILGTGGTLLMVGGSSAAERAALNGGDVRLQGTINANFGTNHINADAALENATVNASGRLEFNGATTVLAGTFSTGPSGLISLDGATTYLGGGSTLSGEMQQNGNAHVTGATTIQGGTFDMDGTTGATVWTLTNVLSVQANQIDSGFLNQFDGSIHVANASGRLEVIMPGTTGWTMAGDLQVNSAGVPTFNSLLSNRMNLAGTTTINANTSFRANATLSGAVNIANGRTLSLQQYLGATTYSLNGGTISGVSGAKLQVAGGVRLDGKGTINSNLEGLTGSEVFASSGLLTINGTLADLGVIGTRMTGPTEPELRITNVWNTAIATELSLQGGKVTGAAIMNGGTTSGHGLIATAGFQNDGILSANGGTLTLHTTNYPDLDGFFNNAVVNAINGPLTILTAGGTEVFRGTFNFGNFPNEVTIANAGIRNQGTMNFLPGVLNAKRIEQAGIVQIESGLSQFGDLGNGIVFLAGSTTNLNGNLQLVGNAVLNSGAVIQGPGSLIVYGGSQLNLGDAAEVSSRVVNEGTLEVGTSPGAAIVGSFAQLGTGNYIAEIDGLMRRTQYDQLEFLGLATLSGKLQVDVNQNGGAYTDPIAPGTFHVFDLIVANSLAGTFDTFLYNGIAQSMAFNTNGGDFIAMASCGLFRILDYSVDGMQLINYRALAGDANADGVVDGTDFGIWNANKFSSGTTWARGDFNCDGVTDGSDFGVWNANKFTGSPLPVTAEGGLALTVSDLAFSNLRAVPEPSACLVVLAGLSLLVSLRRP